ncbi:PDZ domain-containing protein, partial [bacterium]|nr:PDZ domain-containing protein [bacterium]
MKKSLAVFLTLFLILTTPVHAQGGFSDFLKSLGEIGKALGQLGDALSGNSANPNGVNPADFGVSGEWLDSNNAQRLRFPREYSGIGYLISEVTPGGPAAKTGLQRNDIVTHFGNTPLSPQTEEQLQSQVLSGRPIPIKLFRNGQFYEATITPESSSQTRPEQSTQTTNRTASAPVAGTPPGAINPGSCRQGAALEAREYTQPEILGRPSGERAQMCFYRLVGSGAEYLNFFSTGHFYHTSISGSGGFASSGAIYGTVRGTYGFQPNGVLSTRIGYQGTGVSQTNRGAGTERTMDVSG